MINLHALVNPVISALHPNVPGTLYPSTGQTLAADGKAQPAYDTAGRPVSAQMQSEGANTLYHADRVGMEEVSRKFYLFSSADLSTRVAGLVRPLSRGGDLLRLDDGTWWLIDAVLEDFTRSGWVSARATLQVDPPAFASAWP
jgi:hypothetical protein